ncbi:Penicillin-binding protein 1A/1B [Koleobacter methoxysyntrophicus]|jgi:penicillin-binding protein 1A|uniref:Penicillin-binding protein 1A n=1 Tax=Koleobacter methoxysyntrophicus TaxID=2751313 RepID=A0A8A0RNI9_9FIRM|nr:penicillin-binding protein 1A [Koleobacter methoxysyntrophicus]MDI3540464.1 penicillin-binding protein [Thermosediminibacterales bacterium]MDK2901677.1 penicillin-binding protein [Thermosediminibacterales bacterium]QSQ09961.1 Penicillin-binding protein 1A/1B [Koleobacter methoxysyntrophicus]
MSKTNKKKGKTFLKISLLVMIVIFFAAVGSGIGLLAAYIKDAPEFDPEKLETSETSFVFDDNGQLITKLHAEQNRINVKLDVIPEDLINAFIAIEDPRFKEHFGIDIRAAIGALWADIRHMGFVRGASTITQQLVKNAFLSPEKTIKRKVQEVWLAIQIERKYTKEEILEYYLNHIYFGHSANGVQAASQVYFGKDVQELTLAESAMLAGITRNPGIYSPYINFEKAKERQEVILNEMVKNNFITKEEAQKAKEEKIKLAGLKDFSERYKAPFFIDHVIREVVKQLKEEYGMTNDEAFNKIYNGGLRIYTTVNMDIQQKAEEVMSNPENYPEGLVDDKGNPQPQGAIVIIDHSTGHIKALVGGRKHEKRLGLNRATQSFRQPGSAFKPITVYTPAIDMGYTAATVIDDAPIFYKAGKEVWAPENYNRKFNGLTTIRRAIELSINVVAVKVLDQIGIDRAIDYAQNMGIKNLVLEGRKNDRNLPSMALGGLTKGVTPLEMAAAYGTLANQGIYIEPIAFTKVTDKTGRVILEPKQEKRVVVSEQTAYIMTDMLKGVIKRGTGWRLADLPFPAAGKTGTTNDSKDIWFIGYTPHLVGAVWIGHDEPTKMVNVAGGKQPALIWKQVMEYAHKNLPTQDFIKPDKIVGPIEVCSVSGKLPTELCANDPRGSKVISEIFIKGTEPTDFCNTHVKKEICIESNLLATKYCPSSSVKTKIMIQRKEPFIPAEDGRVPLDAPYEVPDEYCNIHGPITEPINNQEPTNLYENIDQEDRFPEDSADPDVQ